MKYARTRGGKGREGKGREGKGREGEMGYGRRIERAYLRKRDSMVGLCPRNVIGYGIDSIR